MDDEARKQLLLTRIAHERAQLTYDLEVFRTVATPGHVASNAVRSVLPPGLERMFFGSDNGHERGRGSPSISHQLLRAVLVARRYPIVLSIVGGLLARRAIRRVLIATVFGVAVAGGLWFAKQQRH